MDFIGTIKIKGMAPPTSLLLVTDLDTCTSNMKDAIEEELFDICCDLNPVWIVSTKNRTHCPIQTHYADFTLPHS